MKEDIKLMKGNEAIAHAAIRYGADGYFGYPITPQSEVMETLMEEKPWETTGMVVLQAESEVAAINMVYGGASCGKAVMTSSSSPGIIGQMMEKEVLPPFRKRRTEEEIREQNPWATLGKTKNRKRNVITSLELDPAIMEQNNIRFQSTYKRISENEVRFEEINCENADYLIVAFGSMSRICQKTIELAAEEGIKIGLLRPITLWPFPTEAIARHANHVKGILSAELNAGQMVEDVRLAVNGKVRVEHFGRLGGIVPTPDEVLNALKEKLM